MGHSKSPIPTNLSLVPLKFSFYTEILYLSPFRPFLFRASPYSSLSHTQSLFSPFPVAIQSIMGPTLLIPKGKTNLNLTGQKIGDEEAKQLAKALKTNSTLTTLILKNNKIGDDGAKALATALKTNKTLTTLNLSDNRIDDEGAKALAEALKTNRTLAILNLKKNFIGGDGIDALAERAKARGLSIAIDDEGNHGKKTFTEVPEDDEVQVTELHTLLAR